jgi:hypothetical protein
MKKCSSATTAVIAFASIVTLVALSSCDSQKSTLSGPAASESSTIVTSPVFVTDQSTESIGSIETNTSLPDLIVRVCTAPTPDTRGSQIAVSAVVSNVSGLIGAGSSFTCLYLNTSSNLTGASFLGSYLISPIGLHGSHTLSTNVTVPSNQTTGLNYFIAVCDCSNNVTESIEWNNTNEVAVTIN